MNDRPHSEYYEMSRKIERLERRCEDKALRIKELEAEILKWQTADSEAVADLRKCVDVLQAKLRSTPSWIPIATGKRPREGQNVFVLQYGLVAKIIEHWIFSDALLPLFSKFDFWIDASSFIPPQPPPEEVQG